MALGIGSGRYAPAPTWRASDVDHLIATLFQDAREGVLVVDGARRVVASNQAAAALLGIEEGRLTARARCASILHCSKNDECPLVLDGGTSRRVRSKDMPFECVIGDRKGDRVVLASCHRLPASSGAARGMILIRDITAQKAAETALIEMANRDPLTGLYNRRYFDAALRSVLDLARPVSLLMIDVDAFKLYNDTYGHQQGDRALAAIARLLVGKTRQRDIVARYGGRGVRGRASRRSLGAGVPRGGKTPAGGCGGRSRRYRSACGRGEAGGTPDRQHWRRDLGCGGDGRRPD